MDRKKPGQGILPLINIESAHAFEDAFVVLVDFGEREFTNYVSCKPVNEQERVFNVIALFKAVLERYSDVVNE